MKFTNDVHCIHDLFARKGKEKNMRSKSTVIAIEILQMWSIRTADNTIRNWNWSRESSTLEFDFDIRALHFVGRAIRSKSIFQHQYDHKIAGLSKHHPLSYPLSNIIKQINAKLWNDTTISSLPRSMCLSLSVCDSVYLWNWLNSVSLFSVIHLECMHTLNECNILSCLT